MRFTRAAKVAAFPLTALILVALIACQGPAGPTGTDGGKGDPGPAGPTGGTGGTGEPGVDTLTDRGTKPVLVIINNVKNAADADVIGPIPGAIDMSAQFRGGYEPIKYSFSMVPATGNTSAFTVDKLDADTGMLTIKLRVATLTDPADLYTIDNPAAENANVITITATDDEGNEAKRAVHILANKAPTAGSPTPVWAATVGTEMRADKDVLACSAFDNNPIPAANTAHQCTLEATTTQFADDDSLTLSVVKGSSKASVAADGLKLTITGIGSTWNPKGGADGMGGHDAAELMIRATDSNDLYVERSLQITVDAAPNIKRMIQSRTLKDEGAAKIVARNVIEFFSDDSNVDIEVTTATVDSSDKTTATAAVDGEGHLTVMPLNPGTTEISVTATEGTTLDQQVTQKFMVTVTNANP